MSKRLRIQTFTQTSIPHLQTTVKIILHLAKQNDQNHQNRTKPFLRFTPIPQATEFLTLYITKYTAFDKNIMINRFRYCVNTTGNNTRHNETWLQILQNPLIRRLRSSF